MVKIVLILKFGRRVPKNLFSRLARKLRGILTYQETLWQILKQSFEIGKKKADEYNVICEIITDKEEESKDFLIEWYIVYIRGKNNDLQAEYYQYKQGLRFWDKFENNNLFKKMKVKTRKDKDNVLSKMFITKLVPKDKIKELFNKGSNIVKKESIARILLKSGIISYMEWVDDKNNRINPEKFENKNVV